MTTAGHRLVTAALALATLAGGCDWLWPTDAPYDPGRCVSGCDAHEICHNGVCTKRPQCPTGTEALALACASKLDTTCKQHEVPIPGGGCKAVGVLQCPTGVNLPADQTCTSIGNSGTCAKGFSKTKDGWCEPLLPKVLCGPFKKATLGQTKCLELMDCGSGPWGNTSRTASTVHVLKSYDGAKGTPDGSADRPYTSIAAAVAAAPAGGQLAIGDGYYLESLVINKPLTVVGRCPDEVTIGDLATNTPYTVDLQSSSVTIVGVTIRGNRSALLLSKGKVTVDRVVISAASEAGVTLRKDAELTLSGSIITNTSGAGLLMEGGRAQLTDTEISRVEPSMFSKKPPTGIRAEGSSRIGLQLTDCLIHKAVMGIVARDTKLTLERTAIVDLRNLFYATTSWKGAGILASVSQQSEGSLKATDCLVADVDNVGVHFQGLTANLKRVVIRDINARQLDRKYGEGIIGDGQQKPALINTPDKLYLIDSVVARTGYAGVRLSGVSLLMRKTLVQQPYFSGSYFGVGLQVTTGQWGASRIGIEITDSVVDRAWYAGMLLSGVFGTIERSVVRDTGSDVRSQVTGVGMLLLDNHSTAAGVTIRDSLVSGNLHFGVGLFGARATLERTVVTGTSAMEGDLFGGAGVVAAARTSDNVSSPSALTITDSVVAANSTFGVGLFGASGIVERSVIRGTTRRSFGNDLGHGIHVERWGEQQATLSVKDSLLMKNRGSGINMRSAAVEVSRCLISGGRDAGGHRESDGISARADDTASGASLMVYDTLMDRSARAGVYAKKTSCNIQRSVLRGGRWAVVLEDVLQRQIGADNIYQGNGVYGVTLDQRFASSTPSLLPPVSLALIK